MTVLVVDLSNITYACRHSLKDEVTVGFIIHYVLTTIYDTATSLRCDHIVIACDAGSWRKDVFDGYKSGRKDIEDPYREEVYKAIDELIHYFRKYTEIPLIRVHNAEADDVIYQLTKVLDDDIIIMSSDKDFIQLISDKVRLYSPIRNMGFRESDDPKFDLFVKIIRGDAGDSIPSSYPRVRLTKLKEAYTDPEKMLDIMETRRKDGRLVKEVFELNRTLIDLSQCPEDIQLKIRDVIFAELNKGGEKPRSLKDYGEVTTKSMKVLEFYEKHGLVKMADRFLKDRRWINQRRIENGVPSKQ